MLIEILCCAFGVRLLSVMRDQPIFYLIYYQVSISVVAILEHSGSNQKEDTCTTGLSVSIGFNALLLVVVLFLLW